MADENNEGDVSLKGLVDQLDEEDRMVEDANAVLGGSDDDRCTFPDGYVGRQALYSCITCRMAKIGVIVSEKDDVKDGVNNCVNGHDDLGVNGVEKVEKSDEIKEKGETRDEKFDKNEVNEEEKESDKNKKEAEKEDGDECLAGVCLACSLNCHEGHDLVELYTKRNFQCDCGNSKFPSDLQCKLCPDKPSDNPGNTYNQNFKGLYCSCHRPYPDPQLENEEDMIQCVTCEDWFHAKHLSETLRVDQGDFEELVCGGCMTQYAFLWLYVPLCKAFCEDGIFPKDNIENEDDAKIERKDENGEIKGKEKKDGGGDGMVDVEKNGDTATVSVIQGSHCPLKKHTPPTTTSPVYWPSKWRNLLCQCDSCKELYRSNGLGYLFTEGDSISEYEEAGKLRMVPGETPLSRLNHVQKIELIQGYTDLKVNLSNYLKKFAENGKVVRQEDIQEFFEMQSRKRRKTNNANQYFCK